MYKVGQGFMNMAPKGETYSPNRKSGNFPIRAGQSDDEGYKVKSASTKRRIQKTASAAKTTTGGPLSSGQELQSEYSKSNRKASQAKNMLYTDTDGMSNTIEEAEEDL